MVALCHILDRERVYPCYDLRNGRRQERKSTRKLGVSSGWRVLIVDVWEMKVLVKIPQLRSHMFGMGYNSFVALFGH